MVLTRRWSLIDRESEAKIVLDDALFNDVQTCYTSAKAIVHTASGPSSPEIPTSPKTVYEIPDSAWPKPSSPRRPSIATSPVVKEPDVVPVRDTTSEHHEIQPVERASLQMNEHLDIRPVQRDSCAVEPLTIRPKEPSRYEHKELPKIVPEESPKDDAFDDQNAKHQGSPDSEDDPEPDFKDPGFPPAVYAELIATLQQEVHREIKAGNYDKAELAHLKTINYLTNREISLKIPYENEDKSQMNEILAEIYVKQKQYDKAKTILSSLLRQEKADSDRKWRLYYLLAGVYLESKRLPEAEKFAKRAYAGREKLLGKGHGLILQSAAQLVQIYEAKGETEAAQAFRNLYDSSSIQRNLAPQIAKHIGTKRVKWNPDISVDINALQKNGETPLITAVTCGDDEMLQRVLQAGAGIEVRGPDGMSPLMHAIWHGHLKIAGVLLSRGAQVDAPTSGWTPLHKACDMGDLNMVNLLLQNDADIEARSPKKLVLKKTRSPDDTKGSAPSYSSDEDNSDDSDSTHGWTALLRASSTGKEPVVRRLLDRNADIEARSPSKATPLICAAEAQDEAIVDLLLLRGAKVEAEDEFGWKPLHRTLVSKGGDKVAQLLLDHDADLNAVDLYKKTPLHHAVEKNNEDMVCFFLRAGSHIEARDVAQRTPLFTAIECRLENMVYILLEFGADAYAKDRSGRDALGAANHAMRKSPEIVKLLSRHKKSGGQLGQTDSRRGSRRDSSALSTASTVVSSSGVPSSDVTSPRPESSSGASWWSRKSSKGKNKR